MLIGISSGANVITYEAEDVTNKSASLKGNLTNMGGETSVCVYFMVGLRNGAFFDISKKQIVTSTGNFSADDFESPLFFSDHECKYKAVAIFGDTVVYGNTVEYGDTKYFTIGTVAEFDDRNLSTDYDNLDVTNLSIQNFAESIYGVYDRVGTGFGQMFLLIILGLPFIAMYIRQQSVLIPSLSYLILSGVIYSYFPGTLRPLIFGLLALCVCGLILTIMKGRQR